VPILRKRVPAMQLHITESFTHQLAEALRQGEVDVVVVALPFEEPGCVTQALYDEPFLVAMPLGHPWEKRKQIPADELKRESLLLLGEGHCLRDQVLEFCGPVGRAGRGSIGRSLQGGSLETIRQMVATGVGVTVLPSTAVSARPEASELIRIRPFTRPVPRRRVAIAWRRSYPRPEAIAALRDAILACDLPQVTRID
jgi:LysR family hydrogen peroxide-inducible transcriptional activator